MGLFNKGKLTDMEQEVLHQMLHSELLNNLICTLQDDPQYQWTRAGRHGTPSWRKVTVEPSGFIIEVPSAYEKKIDGAFISVNFEAAGYHQISEHYNSSGKTDITSSRMCFLYATAIQQRLQAFMGDCKFDAVRNNRKEKATDGLFDLVLNRAFDLGARAEFTYNVPMPPVNSLF